MTRTARVWARPVPDGWQLLIGVHDHGTYTEELLGSGRVFTAEAALRTLLWMRPLLEIADAVNEAVATPAAACSPCPGKNCRQTIGQCP